MSRIEITRSGFGSLFVEKNDQGLLNHWAALGFLPVEDSVPEPEDIQPKPPAKKATTPRRRK